jgi:hypothetical protein
MRRLDAHVHAVLRLQPMLDDLELELSHSADDQAFR